MNARITPAIAQGEQPFTLGVGVNYQCDPGWELAGIVWTVNGTWVSQGFTSIDLDFENCWCVHEEQMVIAAPDGIYRVVAGLGCWNPETNESVGMEVSMNVTVTNQAEQCGYNGPVRPGPDVPSCEAAAA